MSFADDIPLDLRIAQAAAWCDRHGDLSRPAESLRSRELHPSVLGRSSTVDELVWLRSIRLEPQVRMAPRSFEELGGGRLLVYFPDDEQKDGAAEARSQGFFDGRDVPPWDTWVALFSDEGTEHLLSWVPAEFVAFVDPGVRVTVLDCLRWLDETDLPVARELRSRNFLRQSGPR